MKSLAIAFSLFCAVATADTTKAIFRWPRTTIVDGSSNNPLIADVNGDSIPDLIWTGAPFLSATTDIQVRLGMTDLSYGPPITTAIGSGPAPLIVVSDLDADGKLDVIAVDFAVDSKTVRIFLSNGDGTFRSGSSFPLAATTCYVPPLVADFNGDGIPDVLTGGCASTGIITRYVFLGHGDGTFASPVATSSPGGRVEAANVNGDSARDLIIQADTSAYVQIAQGDGTFGAAASIPALSTSSGWAVKDFNADGLDDYVGRVDARMTVFLNAGNGTFAPSSSAADTRTGGPIQIGDLNHDGILDVIAVEFASGRISVFLGQSGGALADPTIYAGVGKLTDSTELWIADIDGDGNRDVNITANRDNLTLLWTVFSNADGTLRADRSYSLKTASTDVMGPTSTAVSPDQTGDAIPDIVVVSSIAGQSDIGIFVLPGVGGGIFRTSIRSATGIPTAAVTNRANILITDLDQDGRPDVAIAAAPAPAGDGQMHIFLANADGTYRAAATVANLTSGTVIQILAGDFTSDGLVDLLALYPAKHAVYPNSGNGVFSGSAIVEPGPPECVGVVTDFNRDGRLDVEEGITTLLGNGDGTFARATGLSGACPSFGCGVTAAADLNGDGIPDFVTTASLHTCVSTTPSGYSEHSNSGPLPATVNLTDIDGDGSIDMVSADRVALGDGAGSFLGGVRSPSDTLSYLSSAVADLDGNGSPDVAGAFGGNVDVFLTWTSPALEIPGTLTLTYSPNPATYGSTVTVTGRFATWSGLFPAGVAGFHMPGYDQSVLPQVDRNSPYDGFIFQWRPPLTAGTYDLSSTYANDPFHAPATASCTVVIQKATPTLTIRQAPYPNPVYSENNLTFYIAIKNSMTGTLSVRDETTTWWTGPVAEWLIVRVPTMPTGEHSLTIEYSGDANFLPATRSVAQTITVYAPKPTITLIATPSSPQFAGTPVTLTATLGTHTDATGNIAFVDITTGSIIATVPIAQGVATLTTASLLPRDYRFVATYLGDASHSASDSPIVVYSFEVPLTDGFPLSGWGSSNEGGLNWPTVWSAVQYDVYEWQSGQYFFQTTAPGRQIKFPLIPTSAHVFKVRASNASGTVAWSQPRVVVGVTFVDAQITSGLVAKLAHVARLETAVDALRIRVGLARFAFSDPPESGGIVRASHIQELRSALAEACAIAGLPFPVSEPILIPGASIIRAAHLQEMMNVIASPDLHWASAVTPQQRTAAAFHPLPQPPR